MLLSHRCKFIFTKTKKTAGTSVESYFERYCMPEGEWSLSHGRDQCVSESGVIGFRGGHRTRKLGHEYLWWNHMPAKTIKEQVSEEIWDSYFKFTVIRNPYDKALSQFYFARYIKHGRQRKVEFTDYDQEREMFEEWLCSCKRQVLVDRNKYIIDGEFCLDDTIRYERLTADVERICSHLSLPWDPSGIPHFKTGIRPDDSVTEKMYSDKSRKFIEDIYSFELDYFGYSFPDAS